jgi:hypothetical protein
VTIDADLIASLNVGMGNLCQRLDRQWQERAQMGETLRSASFIVSVPLTGGATSGTYFSQSPNLGPAAGFVWSVRALVAQGYTAGTVTVWQDNPGGATFAGFPQAGLYTFGRRERLLRPMSQMVIVASGISGTLQICGDADVMPAWYLPYYH